MTGPRPKLRVVLTAPNIHEKATGEEYVAFKWAEALSHKVDLTVVGMHWDHREPLGNLLPEATVKTFSMPKLFNRFPRFEAMLKPSYPVYLRRVRGWLREQIQAGVQYDITHQIMPQAARYPSPLRGLGVPYVIGPLGGSLDTPAGFEPEMASAQWFTRLRKIDPWRVKYDPWLRKTYRDASLMLGVAPYMEDILSPAGIARFAPVLELGVEDLPPKRDIRPGQDLRLLHVGRGVRTKGLRDVVRAMAQLKDIPGLTLTSAGSGPEIDICRAEAARLGVDDRITFLGQISRAEVEKLYQTSDVFVFPSFREPAGNVLYEAMRNSLPIIAAARGGPDWIVDENVGIKVTVSDPETMASDVAGAIRRLIDEPGLRKRFAAGGREKLRAEGFWEDKADQLIELYHDTLAHHA